MTPEDALHWNARRRQLEIILRAYRDDCTALRLAEDQAAFPAHPPSDTGIHPQGAVSDPTFRGVVWLTQQEAVAWARWRAGVVWSAYAQLDADLRNVVALTYWHFSGGDLSWQEAARLMHVEKTHYYRLLNRALHALDTTLPRETHDLALWFGEVAAHPSGDAGE